MNLPRITLDRRLPLLGPEFQVGHNCTSIETTPDGILIREPRTEGRGELCAFDLLVRPESWAKLPRQELPKLLPAAPSAPPRPICGICGAEFQNQQGLGSHMTRKHPK